MPAGLWENENRLCERYREGLDMIVKTEEMKVVGFDDEMDELLREAEFFAGNMNLTDRESLRFRLLTEETMSMVRQITGKHVMTLKFIGEGKKCTIHLAILTEVDSYVRENLLDLSKSGKNEAAKGVLGKMRDVVDRFLAARDSDLTDMPPEYMQGYMMMGMPSGFDYEMNEAFYWTLDNYRASVEDEKGTGEEADEDWDELEKSVVANLADDVRIGIQGKHVTVDVIKKFG